MVTTDTRQRLLDVAEGLFADQGLKGTSLRAITSAAEANLAAVNYHFGTKEGLFAAVFQRRIGPMTVERIRLLDQALEAAAPDAPALEDVLRAYLAPTLGLLTSHDPGAVNFPRLLGRVFSESGEIKIQVLNQFRPSAERFLEVLAQILPELPHAELMWRLHFLIGSLAHTTASGKLICLMSGGACDPDDVEGLLERLTTYAAAGFQAPSR